LTWIFEQWKQSQVTVQNIWATDLNVGTNEWFPIPQDLKMEMQAIHIHMTIT